MSTYVYDAVGGDEVAVEDGGAVDGEAGDFARGRLRVDAEALVAVQSFDVAAVDHVVREHGAVDDVVEEEFAEKFRVAEDLLERRFRELEKSFVRRHEHRALTRQVQLQPGRVQSRLLIIKLVNKQVIDFFFTRIEDDDILFFSLSFSFSDILSTVRLKKEQRTTNDFSFGHWSSTKTLRLRVPSIMSMTVMFVELVML